MVKHLNLFTLLMTHMFTIPDLISNIKSQVELSEKEEALLFKAKDIYELEAILKYDLQIFNIVLTKNPNHTKRN